MTSGLISSNYITRRDTRHECPFYLELKWLISCNEGRNLFYSSRLLLFNYEVLNRNIAKAAYVCIILAIKERKEERYTNRLSRFDQGVFSHGMRPLSLQFPLISHLQHITKPHGQYSSYSKFSMCYLDMWFKLCVSSMDIVTRSPKLCRSAYDVKLIPKYTKWEMRCTKAWDSMLCTTSDCLV